MKSRELKKDAISKFSDKFGKLFLIQLMYILINIAFSLLLTKLPNLSSGLSAIIFLAFVIITTPFSFGVLSSIVRLSKGEDVPVTEFINIGLKNFAKYWKVTLRIALKMFLPLILFLIVMAGIVTFVLVNFGTSFLQFNLLLIMLILIVYLLSLVFMVYLVLPYSVSMFVLNEHPEKNSKEVLETSALLMKNNKWNYVKLLLSFIGWFLLTGVLVYLATYYLPETASIIVEYIPTLLLVPYMSITQLSFYEHIKNSNINVEVEPASNEE